MACSRVDFTYSVLCLTLNLLTTTIVAPPCNANKWQMGFNSAFKGLKTNHLMLYRETIAVCSQSHTEHINIRCGQNVGFVNVKPSGTYSNHWA